MACQAVAVEQAPLSNLEIMAVVPDRAKVTPVETALLPALIKLSKGGIDMLLRRMRAALGPDLLRWGSLKDVEKKFLEDSHGVCPLPQRAYRCPLGILLPQGSAFTWARMPAFYLLNGLQ